MNYLPRTIQPVIEEASKFFKIVMVSGMRQVGKSTLLKQLSSDKRTIISFDDINNLESAKNAPLQFLQLNPPPCFFNQVQRVPEIFKALGKLCKIRNFSQSPFGGFIFEESDGNFPSGRN